MIALAVMLACGAVAAAWLADARAATEWATGPALQKRLARPVNIVWSGNPLRQALGSLSLAEEVAMLLDRRVDPGHKLQLALDQEPLGSAFQAIAKSQELGVAMLGPVAYFGPPLAASRIRTVAALRAEEARRLPANAGRQFLQPKPIAWRDFATPRELLEQLAQQHGLALKGLDQVPHDLWAGADLPPLSLVDRITLIAAQFELTFQVAADGKAITLVPIPDEVAIERAYEGGRQPQAVAKQYAALAPNAQIKVAGGKVVVNGLLEDHERITSPSRPVKHPVRQPTQDAGKTRIDKMAVKDAPVGKVLEELAGKLKLELRVDHKALQEAGISLDARVSVSVQNVTVDQLLREITKPAGLEYRRRGNVLEIGPAQ